MGLTPLSLVVRTIAVLVTLLRQGQSIEGESKLPTILTCCSKQSVLNRATGVCGRDSYEFESEEFPPIWNWHGVPKTISSVNTSFSLAKRREPWCPCVPKEGLTFTFEKRLQKDGWERTGEGSRSKVTLHIADGQTKLVLNGEKTYGNQEFCLNSLEDRSDSDVPWRLKPVGGLSFEFIVCQDKCSSPILLTKEEEAGKSEEQKTDWVQYHCPALFKELEVHQSSSNLSSSEEPHHEVSPLMKECVSKGKWVTVYHRHTHGNSHKDVQNKFLLIVKSSKTKGIQGIEDSTYPWGSLPHNTYCKDHNDSLTQAGYSPSHEDYEETARFCLTAVINLFWDWQKVYAILAGLSALFLLFNLTIYFALRHSLSISGWTEYLYCWSLYAYFTLSVIALLSIPVSEGVTPFCYTLSVLIQYFELMNGGTLTALSFDLFWTFCKFDSERYTDDPKLAKWRLVSYVLFSTLLFPVPILVFGIGKNLSGSSNSGGYYFGPIPQYGLLHCSSPSWTLTSLVLFVTQGLNLVLVLLSAYIILRKKNVKTGRLNGVGERDEDEHYLDPDRLDIFSKLFLFVLFFWMVSFTQFLYDKEGTVFTQEGVLIAFRIANYLQGISAFLILIFNRRTLRLIGRGEWGLEALFRHACCTCGSDKKEWDGDDGGDHKITREDIAMMPTSPLMKEMKTTTIRRSTVRGNDFY